MPLDRQSLRQAQAYAATAPIPQLLADLAEVETLDQVAEAKLARLTTVLISGVVGSFVAIFLAIFLPPVGIVLLVVGLLAAAYAGIRMSQVGQFDTPNYRYGLLQQVLDLVNRDLAPATPVTVHLGLSSPHVKEKCVQTLPHPYRSGWKMDLFRDPWLQLQGQFIDNTQFLLECTELHRSAYGWKRSRTGKSKFKRKYKAKGLDLCLILKCSHRRALGLQVLQSDVVAAVKLPPEVVLKQVEVTDKGLLLQVKTPPWIEPAQLPQLQQTVAMMFLSLYQVLNLAKELIKSP